MRGRAAILALAVASAPVGQIAAATAEVSAPPAEAVPFRLELPVDCPIGPVCVVQHYVDMAPGPGAADHTCGSLTYEGHRGIDIRTLTRAQMEEGVDVVAAAPGIVRLTRDGMADRTIRTAADDKAVSRRYSGNTVEILHRAGWVTKYSHLKNASIRVKPGQRVAVGTPLGQIGLSGRTQFPHVEFTVFRKGEVVDPFTGLAPASGCGNFERSYWSEAAATELGYQPGGLLVSGIAARLPDYPEVMEQRHQPALPDDPGSLVVWFVAWGLMAGDRLELRLVDAAGVALVDHRTAQAKTQIQTFHAVGRKRPATGWPSGTYRAAIRIMRPVRGKMLRIADRNHEVTLR